MSGVRLSFRDNGDSLDTVALAQRAARVGVRVLRATAAEAGYEAGDYWLDLDRGRAHAVSEVGVELTCADPPAHAEPVHAPHTALLCGEVSAWPYFGFYTVCLFRLGLAYRPVAGGDVAGGALVDRDLFVLPGGFATWGLDAGESAPGADRQVRAFLARGGGCIGSCGGAYYLSSGRPGWTGTLNAVPRFTHEYLQSGAAVVRVALEDDPLRCGLPPSIELPYYHGPVYEVPDIEVATHVDGANAPVVAGTFRAPCLPSRLMIDNPLDAARFERTHAGRAALVRCAGPRGRSVLFSPHPEMGDLMRKYMALDGYVRRYLPVRGEKTLDDTLRFYRPLESPAFRLVANAVQWLGVSATRAEASASIEDEGVDLDALVHEARAHLTRRERDGDTGMEALMAAESQRLRSRLDACGSDALRAGDPELVIALAHAARHALAAMRATPTPDPVRTLFDVDLLVCTLEAAGRMAAIDAALVD